MEVLISTVNEEAANPSIARPIHNTAPPHVMPEQPPSRWRRTKLSGLECPSPRSRKSVFRARRHVETYRRGARRNKRCSPAGAASPTPQVLTKRLNGLGNVAVRLPGEFLQAGVLGCLGHRLVSWLWSLALQFPTTFWTFPREFSLLDLERGTSDRTDEHHFVQCSGS